MNKQFQELRDYLDTASRGFATMRGQGPDVARVGYRAGKMFQTAREMLDKGLEHSLGAVTGVTVPPDEPEPPKRGPRNRRI